MQKNNFNKVQFLQPVHLPLSSSVTSLSHLSHYKQSICVTYLPSDSLIEVEAITGKQPTIMLSIT